MSTAANRNYNCQSDEEFHTLVLEYLEYDHDDGELRWLKTTSPRVSIGDCAGTINPDGYIQIQFMGILYKAHRLVWFIVHKTWPSFEIDHEDRNRSNNRIKNLRDATSLENSNNSGIHADNLNGHKGVAYDPKYAAKPWRVQISRKGKVIHRSHYVKYEEACQKAREIYEALGSPSE